MKKNIKEHTIRNSNSNNAPGYFFPPKPSINLQSLEKNTVTAFVPNGDPVNDKPVPQEDGKIETVATTEVKAGTTISCEPTGVTYDEFLKKTGNIDDAFGITRLSSDKVTFPEVVLTKGILQSTTAGMQVSSFYLKAQTFKDKGIVIMPEEGGPENNYCPKGRYERFWEITSSGADKIKEGEQEHCNDFTLAFNLSLAKFRDAVNTAAGKRFTSDTKAKAYLEKQTKVHPDKWKEYFWCLAKKTEERDSNNWHLPKSFNPRINKTCDKAVIRMAGVHLPEIGKHPSTEIIKDCDIPKDK